MKDKLVKTGHRKPYYRMRAALMAFLLLLGVGSVCATPVLVTYAVSHATYAQVEESSSAASEEEIVVADSSIE